VGHFVLEPIVRFEANKDYEGNFAYDQETQLGWATSLIEAMNVFHVRDLRLLKMGLRGLFQIPGSRTDLLPAFGGANYSTTANQFETIFADDDYVISLYGEKENNSALGFSVAYYNDSVRMPNGERPKMESSRFEDPAQALAEDTLRLRVILERLGQQNFGTIRRLNLFHDPMFNLEGITSTRIVLPRESWDRHSVEIDGINYIGLDFAPIVEEMGQDGRPVKSKYVHGTVGFIPIFD